MATPAELAHVALTKIGRDIEAAAHAPAEGGPRDAQIHAVQTAMRAAARCFDVAAALFDAIEPDMKAGIVEDGLIQFYKFDTSYEMADEARKGWSKKIEFMKNSLLPDLMAEREVKSITIRMGDEAKRFTTNQRTSASMQDKEAGMQWLKDNHPGLVTETVNSSSLSAFAKSYAEDTGADLPEFFKISQMRYISVTKA